MRNDRIKALIVQEQAHAYELDQKLSELQEQHEREIATVERDIATCRQRLRDLKTAMRLDKELGLSEFVRHTPTPPTRAAHSFYVRSEDIAGLEPPTDEAPPKVSVNMQKQEPAPRKRRGRPPGRKTKASPVKAQPVPKREPTRAPEPPPETTIEKVRRAQAEMAQAQADAAAQG